MNENDASGWKLTLSSKLEARRARGVDFRARYLPVPETVEELRAALHELDALHERKIGYPEGYCWDWVPEAARVVLRFEDEHACDDDLRTVLVDMIHGLLHLSDVLDVSFEGLLAGAREHYVLEVLGDDFVLPGDEGCP